MDLSQPLSSQRSHQITIPHPIPHLLLPPIADSLIDSTIPYIAITGMSNPASAQSGSPTIAGVNGRKTFPFKVYANVPCDISSGGLTWRDVTSEGEGTAEMDPDEMDPHRKAFKYEWKGPLTDSTGKVYEGHCFKTSLDAESHLRLQTTPDGSRYRYVQTFYEKSKQPDKENSPVNAEKLLVSSWFKNPSVRSTIDPVSAEEDNSPQIPVPKEEDWMVVDQRQDVDDDEKWMKVAGYRWATVHKTGPLRSYVLPGSKYSSKYEGYRDWRRDA